MRSLCSAMRLRSRQVICRIGSSPAPTSIVAAVSAARCGRAPAPSVMLTASARPLSGRRLGQQFVAVGRDRRRHLGGDDKTPLAQLFLQVHGGQRSRIQWTLQAEQWEICRGSALTPRSHTGRTWHCWRNPWTRRLRAIGDGCLLVVPREVSGVPMAATRALIRRHVKRLHLVALPTSSLQADLLIGAGCVATLETSAVSLGEFGPAPRFTAAITARHDHDERRHLPGAARGLAGGGERRAVHAAARADRLRCAQASRRLDQ